MRIAKTSKGTTGMRLQAGTAFAASLALALGLGCVTSGTYDAVVKERDTLASENQGLALDNAEIQSRIEWLEQENRKLLKDVQSRTGQADELRSAYDDMVSKLKSELEHGRVTIEQLRDGLSVNVSQEILFSTGSAWLSDQGRDVLGKVSEELVKSDFVIEVQGHTDNVPIGSALAGRYPSNWELAGARAASVVRLLEENGVGGGRLVAASYGENDPVASNSVPDGRARNRRIEIRLLPIGPGDTAEEDEGNLPASIED